MNSRNGRLGYQLQELSCLRFGITGHFFGPVTIGHFWTFKIFKKRLGINFKNIEFELRGDSSDIRHSMCQLFV